MSSEHIVLVTDTKRVVDIAATVAAHGRMAFDIEFVSEGRLIPELSLLQVAWGQDASVEVAVLDCVALGRAGLEPMFAVLGREDVAKVAHSARQDLGLLAVRYQVQVAALWDTQIAAAFVGLGDQIGYAKLVQRLLGVKLDKSQQFTAWLDRPLRDRQLRYAVDDVRYLPAVWEALGQELDRLGRRGWVGEESQRLARSVGPMTAPELAFQDVKGWNSLRGPALASLRALAAWRLHYAVAENRPLSWIVPDRTMIELCRNGIKNAHDLRAIRGVGEGIARRHGQAILAAIHRGAGEEPPAFDPVDKTSLSPRARIWASMLAGLIQARCLAADIAPRFVATRNDAEALAAWFDRDNSTQEPDIQLLQGWRRELAGEAALAWLRGDKVIAAATSSAAIELRDAAPSSRS